MFTKAIIAGAVLALAACGGGSDGDAAGAEDGEAWLSALTDEDFPIEELDGVEVAVDESERMIYVEECADARRLTSQGKTYEGFGFYCPS